MINVAILILLSLIIVFVIFIIIKITKQPRNESLGLLQQQVDNLRGQVSESLGAHSQVLFQQLSELNKNINQNLQMLTQQLLSSQQSVGERLDAATRVVGQVQKDLGFLSLATERVFEVGKNIAGLEEILSAPKLRGGLGEFFLQDLLQQVLPSSHVNFQYKFKNGDVVDAVILMGKGKVCIDSKFPLDNFRRIIDSGNDEEKRKARKNFYSDVKKHIDVIAAKYILPDEGTFDFALMYIPAENVYYELIIREDSDNGQSLSSYGLSKKVIPVSPNSLYIFLQAIVCGLNGMRVEQHVQQIIQHLARLRGDIDRFKQDFDVLGRHIMNMKNKYDEADKKITDFEGKLTAVCQFEKNE